MNPIDKRKPNDLLRHERESRGWTQERVADELYQHCKDDSRVSKRGDINTNMISRWESGKHRPNHYWQEQLRLLYGKSLEELGFVEPLPSLEHLPTYVFTGSQSGTVTLPASHQAIDLLLEASETTPEALIGAWIALQAGDLAVLFQEGWSIEDILASLRVVLKGVQALSNMSRRALGRTLLQLGAAAALGGILIPSGRHLSAEELFELHHAMGESIAAGWNLFQTAGNAQVLAVGQAELALLKQIQSVLYPSVLPMFYSAAYRLVGAALFFQRRYEDAHHAHNCAYTAALEGADGWNMAQCRIWQAYGYQERGQHAEAIQFVEAALRLIAEHNTEASRRLRSHLLAVWAENAAMIKADTTVQEKLEASLAMLDGIGPNEEFDRAHWHQKTGNCALRIKDYSNAIHHFEEAQKELLPHLTMRQAVTLVPLAVAYARAGERDASLTVARKVVPLIGRLNAPILNRQFAEYMRGDLLRLFPSDAHEFIADVRHQLPQIATLAE